MATSEEMVTPKVGNKFFVLSPDGEYRLAEVLAVRNVSKAEEEEDDG